MSQDPIGFEGGLNSYVYANQNPTTLVDPSGLVPGPGAGGEDFVLMMNSFDLSLDSLEVSQSHLNLISGYGDGASFGASRLARHLMGTSDFVDTNSADYSNGQTASFLSGILRLGYALTVRAIPHLAQKCFPKDVSKASLLAYRLRNLTKIVFRGPSQIGGRLYRYNKLLNSPKYGGDPQKLLWAAGRTGAKENAYGAWMSLSGASQCMISGSADFTQTNTATSTTIP